MIGRSSALIVLLLVMSGCACRETPPPLVAPRATKTLPDQTVAPQRHMVAKPISSSGSGELVLFSPATPEATRELPLDHDFPGLPEVPGELLGPAPPMEGD